MAKLRLPDLRDVRVRDGAVRAWSGSRYSHRQGRRIPLRGFAGEAVLAGAGVRALAPLLDAASVTGVGRSEALGFGSLRVEAP
jgi:CRISPR/Cas system endoribonuclease Cas6 (RAMP superfamily)